ncbi:NB-ARC [Dillenia turbinata]|uniref:NB-ARC n=1 Tax=Dillenia turbinata TaxID=194707 RepID=A0AAN8W4V2_9MAGN
MEDSMVQAVVSPAIERITDQLINEFKFLRAVSAQVQRLQDKLKWIQGFLKDADAIMRVEEGQQLRTVVSQFRDIAYDSEDLIDTYILKVASMSREGRGGFIGFLKKLASIFKKWLYIHKVGNEIEAINARISWIRETLPPHNMQNTVGASTDNRRSRQGWRRSYAHEEEEHVVGLDDDIDKLVRELNNEEADARVVSIVGIGGSGKTTLAKRLYNHVLVKKHFDCHLWVSISQQWDSRDVLQSILIQTSSLTKEERELIDKMKNEELVGKLYSFLGERLYLLVLDDIWETKAWDELSHAFPRRKVGSKIILTTRNRYVPRQVDPHCVVHEPRSLTDDEAWELLSKKTKIKEESTSQEVIELCELGKEMVKRCGGLPLAVVVLGGLLATRSSLQEWKKLHQNIGLQLRAAGKEGDQPQGKVMSVLKLSYNDLPYRLKPCFLYLGLFPEDADIRAKKLIRMWIAEGFILSSEIDREHTVESAGEEWLEELIERSMIQVGARDSDGRVKTCRMHDLIRDLCLEQAREENFLEILSPSSPSNPKGLSSINGTDASKVRRIALHVGNDLAFTKRFLLEHRNFELEEWIVEKGAMPRLRHLELYRCSSLRSIPEGLRYISSLKELEIRDVRKEFVERFRKVGNEIEAINARISQIQATLPLHTVQHTAGASIESRRSRQGWRRSYAHDEEEQVVGLEDDVDKLVRELTNEEADAKVVSIVGIGGSGKTTLAIRLYNHDTEIWAKQVIRMWIAEGIISSSEVNSEHTVESAGEEWLEELIKRSMIQVGARDSNGRVKTCRMHDLIRDLCLVKAREDFLEILSPSSPSNPKGFGTDASKVRRIALHAEQKTGQNVVIWMFKRLVFISYM